MSHQTGYLIDLDNEKRPDWEPHAKSLASVMTYAGNTERPEVIDPRIWHRIEHQQRSDCTGHGVSSVGEASYVNGTGRVIQFSPHYSYRTAQEIDGIVGDIGATISGGYEAAKQGLCPLEDCPYPDSYSSPITGEMRVRAAYYRIQSFAIPRDYDEALAVLVSGMGINWGVLWGFDGPGGNVLTTFSGHGPGHATALLGYSDMIDHEGRPYLWLANSGYPEPGWYQVSPDAVNAALEHKWTVAVAVSRLSHPRPEPIAYDPLGAV